MPLAHLLFDASEAGAFELTEHAIVRLGTVDSSYDDHTWGPVAMAGAPCGDCNPMCPEPAGCQPRLCDYEVDVLLEPGEIRELALGLRLTSPGAGEVCEPTALADVNWMNVLIEPAGGIVMGGYDHQVTVWIDARDLAIGTYDGWIRVEGSCTACAHVVLRVSSSGAWSTSWGHLKTLYR